MPQQSQHDLSDLGAKLVRQDDRVRIFLNDFLLAFEKILLGRDKDKDDGIVPDHYKHRYRNRKELPFQGLEEQVANLHSLFDPEETPDDFLDWLASWAALSLRANLSLERKRELLARIIPLYRIRGTKKYVEDLLALLLEAKASVDDGELPALQVGVRSTIGKDTYLDGGPPHFFRVRLEFPGKSWPELNLQCQVARSVIDLAKPAHTHYELEVPYPRMQVGVHSTVGLDTVLGA